MKICIVGGGNIAHALISILGSDSNNQVLLLTSKPEFGSMITAELEDGSELKGNLAKWSNKPEEVIFDSELILFTIPAYARKKVLQEVKPFITDSTIIGSFPGVAGFNEEVKEVCGEIKPTVFSAQRVPCIARTIIQGESVKVTLKDEIHIAVNRDSQKIKELLESLLRMRVSLLDDFLEVNLSNSNPILHSARLFQILKDYKVGDYFNEPILFYEEWTDKASEILLAMDEEFMRLVDNLELKNIKSLKQHYEVNNAIEMTKKMRSISAFKNIYMPMIKSPEGYSPDISSRYFTEDVHVGLKYIIDVCKLNNLEAPILEQVYDKLYSLRNLSQ